MGSRASRSRTFAVSRSPNSTALTPGVIETLMTMARLPL